MWFNIVQCGSMLNYFEREALNNVELVGWFILRGCS